MTASHRTRRPRLADGELVALVLTHLRAHPHLEFSTWDIAKVLHRSHGSIHRILHRQTELGVVEQTHEQPARFRITPTPAT